MMRMNFRLFFIPLVATIICSPIAVMSLESNPQDFPWSYSVDEKGMEHTKRTYLLVPNSYEQIQVQSVCQKPAGEARYGICEHRLRYVPSGKTFILHKGEDVVLAGSAFGDIATVEYGCCASPSTYTFYDHDLKPIGSLQPDTGHAGGDGVLGNSIYLANLSDGKMFVETTPDGAGNALLEKDKNGQIKITPVDVEFTDSGSCPGFLFDHYSEIIKPQLFFRGEECGDSRIWYGTCYPAGARLKCILSPHGKK